MYLSNELFRLTLKEELPLQKTVNSILHIGLHVLEEDVESFYKGVLNCEIIRSFSLSKEDAYSIFGIKHDTDIYYISCGNVELELFIGGKTETPTFGHVCFQSQEADSINGRAIKNGYNSFLRKRNSSTTYFISDNNHNLFEIKTIDTKNV